MKFRIEDDWDYTLENFRTEKDKRIHAKKHEDDTLDYYDWTADQYEQEANKLALTPVDYNKIHGYITNHDGIRRYCKWNKETELFVVYVPNGNNPIIISAYHKFYRDYNKHKWRDYEDEIPQGE